MKIPGRIALLSAEESPFNVREPLGDYDVSANLMTYFVFLLVLDTLFLIWPILLSRWEMHKDRSRQGHDGSLGRRSTILLVFFCASSAAA